MQNKSYQYHPIHLPQPEFDSDLTSLVLELEHLRRLRVSGTAYPPLFFQIKELFHMLESIGSARIEGNNTTIARFVETKIEERPFINEEVEEIRNLERAMQWVDEIGIEYPVNRRLVSEFHNIVVDKLTPPPIGEGDSTPGMYRNHEVTIVGARHIPPPPIKIHELMVELFDFINKDLPAKYDLLRIAIAHHRFMWIHPFSNGNGRVGRLLTYAMLIRSGFRVQIKNGQILNPTAVFCIDREAYYCHLSAADSGTNEGIETWCTYVLEGLHREIKKIESLTDDRYVTQNLIKPALSYARKMKYIDDQEYAVLKSAADHHTVQAKDLSKVFKTVHPTTISRKIKQLRDKKMLEPIHKDARQYHLNVINNFLMRGMIYALEKEGYIPLKE